MRNLSNHAGLQQVKPRIAHMPHRHHVVFDESDREDTGHACPFRPRPGETVNLIIRERDGLADTVFGCARGALEAFLQDVDSGRRRMLARRVAAYTVDHGKNAALGIHVIPIFVIRAPAAHVAGRRRQQPRPNRHQRRSRVTAK